MIALKAAENAGIHRSFTKRRRSAALAGSRNESTRRYASTVAWRNPLNGWNRLQLARMT